MVDLSLRSLQSRSHPCHRFFCRKTLTPPDQDGMIIIALVADYGHGAPGSVAVGCEILPAHPPRGGCGGQGSLLHGRQVDTGGGGRPI